MFTPTGAPHFSAGGIVVSLLALGSVQAGFVGGGLGAWSSLGALLLYVGCYQVSFGPISWLIVGKAAAARSAPTCLQCKCRYTAVIAGAIFMN